MKSYIVFSDIHGDRHSFSRLQKITENTDGAFFAGDGISINWLTSARKPSEIQGFRAFYVLTKTALQHFCNT